MTSPFTTIDGLPPVPDNTPAPTLSAAALALSFGNKTYHIPIDGLKDLLATTVTGKSAHDLAVEFAGADPDINVWLASLDGQDGDPGPVEFAALQQDDGTLYNPQTDQLVFERSNGDQYRITPENAGVTVQVAGNKVIYVSPDQATADATGDDFVGWDGIKDAIVYASRFRVSAGYRLIISLRDGDYTATSDLILSHPQKNVLELRAATGINTLPDPTAYSPSDYAANLAIMGPHWNVRFDLLTRSVIIPAGEVIKAVEGILLDAGGGGVYERHLELNGTLSSMRFCGVLEGYYGVTVQSGALLSSLSYTHFVRAGFDINGGICTSMNLSAMRYRNLSPRSVINLLGGKLTLSNSDLETDAQCLDMQRGSVCTVSSSGSGTMRIKSTANVGVTVSHMSYFYGYRATFDTASFPTSAYRAGLVGLNTPFVPDVADNPNNVCRTFRATSAAVQTVATSNPDIILTPAKGTMAADGARTL